MSSVATTAETRRKMASETEDAKTRDESSKMSAERLRSAVEAAEVGTWHVDLGSGIDARDASLNRILGLEAKDSTQLVDDFFQRVHEDDREHIRERFAAAIAGERSYDVEMRVRRPNGELRWVRDVGRIGAGPDGSPLYMTGALTDITELKRAHRAVAESVSFYEQTLESIPGMTFTNKPDGSCDYISRQWVEFTGVSAEAQLGDGWVSVLHPDDRERAFHAWRTAISGHGAYDLEYRVRRHDGVYEWFKVRGRAIRDGTGEIARWLGTAVNVNGLKETEAALRESEERFRTLADNLSQLAWMADAEGLVFWFNRRWFEYSQTTLDDMTGWGWTKLAHPDHVERVVRRIQHSWNTGEPWEDTFPLRGAEGSYRWFLSRALPIRDASGTVVRWFGTNTDITEQRNAEEALRHADRRKDEFLATLAHELRNPLAPIRSGLDLLSRARDETTRRRVEQVMSRQLAHLVRLVDDLLDVARISRGQIVLQRGRVALAEVVEAAVETSRPIIEDGAHHLSVVLPPQPICVDGDFTRLAQVVSNLLNNAAKYTPRGGRIVVELRAAGREGIVRVTDTGIGIDANALPHVFERFAHGPRDPSTKGGLGIGLSLVLELVALHGGVVNVESAGSGHGSSFEVRLPVAELLDAREHVGAEPARGTRPSTLRPSDGTAPGGGESPPDREGRPPGARRILVVDDNVDAADTLATMLELGGHETSVAHDGASALIVAREVRPDLIFLGLGLPDMDGCEVARRLRADPELAKCTLVALTGWGSDDDKRRTSEAGFDVHLTKPVDIARVEAVVSRTG